MIKGEYNYKDFYHKVFLNNYEKFKSIQKRIDKKISKVLSNPYHNTEFLDDVLGRLNLKGCRSIRIDRNFRIIYVICEECRKIKDCEYCFCEGLDEKSVVFLTVNTHREAYLLK
ncbi:MAG: hypothetical protein COS84_03350 [Armatimonadetes bacterium CG07_land_8_20_14_0_80_40_9]|nr:MAG: hypothetical protein COS84_03350 [Armatimonadetes bacterium CG07_land_8_20_14_0_80_40_9]